MTNNHIARVSKDVAKEDELKTFTASTKKNSFEPIYICDP